MRATLLVLAAGMGSRYGGLKQIEPVGPNGELIIDYSVHDAVQAGFDKVVFVVREDIRAEFEAVVGKRYQGLVPVDYVCQDLADLPGDFSVPPGREKPWGTGQAILAARDVISEPFAVINADDFYGSSAYGVLYEYLRNVPDTDCADYAMVAYTLSKTLSEYGAVSRGICVCDDKGYVSSVTERHGIVRDGQDARYVDENGREIAISANAPVSMNFWGFMPSIFEHLETGFRVFLSEKGGELKSEYLIPEVAGNLVERGTATLRMLESPDTWFGITFKEDKPQVSESIRRLTAAGYYPQSLLS